ncbi:MULTISPECIES: hypothetical protein [Microbispora]|uniref:FPG-type domain-containing protein n=1 Tax=Microbispora hainanensis TaxID=568844 RepID=A0ABZ1SR05_9ACTN|nr:MULTISPECIES: hypothetical protein [Microbispora]
MVRATSPQGGFDARPYDGRVVEGVEALLFLTGLDPGARDIGAEAAGRLWDTAVRHLALGRDAGQVVSDPGAPDERWVYKRERCRRCGAAVRTWTLASRTAYACPADQHLHAI